MNIINELNLNISIVIPVFNSQSTLHQCLNSILEAINENDEVIIVNDGSTDKSLEMIKNFSDFKIINNKKNYGAGASRNIGALHSTSEIILFVDSDIIVDKKHLAKVREHFLKNISCDAITANLNTKNFDSNFFTDYKNLYMDYVLSKSHSSVNYIYGSFCAIRKNVFLKWPEDIKYVEDSFWGLKLHRNGIVINFINDIKVIHLKKYSLISLLRNDFQVASSFSRAFVDFKRWETLYTKDNFGHTSKKQKISVLLSVLVLISYGISIKFSMFFILIWLFLNLSFFKYFVSNRNFLFALKTSMWYFFTCIIYFLGIMHGLLFLNSSRFKELEV
jgi:glycosyltransferase involved in cell wall biosynthesis